MTSASKVEGSTRCATRLPLYASLILHNAPYPRPIPLTNCSTVRLDHAQGDGRSKTEHANDFLPDSPTSSHRPYKRSEQFGFPAEEPNTVAHTPNRYWRLLNDLGFTPPAPNPGPPAVLTKVFLGLTQWVQMLTEMMQVIVPYIPQLA
ncbi:hypothetical protein B296_00003892 [Ensete ventricosum]|uniref:Uncharacterized protein n=1 Tax=Ensete ventricosum TaxID=4639 RepID=A0A427AQF7_ENSVE|nr:hypothetical protein B296_00003892 [Ensete ventricosum]